MIDKAALIKLGVKAGMNALKILVSENLEYEKNQNSKNNDIDKILIDTDKKIIDKILDYNGEDISKEEFISNIELVDSLTLKLEEIRKKANERQEKRDERIGRIIRKTALALGTGGLSLIISGLIYEKHELEMKVQSDKIELDEQKKLVQSGVKQLPQTQNE